MAAKLKGIIASSTLIPLAANASKHYAIAAKLANLLGANLLANLLGRSANFPSVSANMEQYGEFLDPTV